MFEILYHLSLKGELFRPMDATQNKDPMKVTDCLNQQSFKALVTKARNIMALDATLKQLVPEYLKPFCRVMNYNENTLVISAESATVALRIKGLSDELISYFKEVPSIIKIHNIVCKIRPKVDS